MATLAPSRAVPDVIPKIRRRRLAQWLPMVFTSLALVHPLAGLLAGLDWRADLLTHFQEPALAITLIALAAAIRRYRRLAGALAVIAVVQAAPLFRYSGANPVPPAPGAPERLRVLMANVLADNGNHQYLRDLIRREQPDVVGLVEITVGWIKGLDDVRRDYPYRMELPIGPQGLALWFRRPPRVLDSPELLTHEGNAVLHAVLDFAGRPRHIWLVHPPNPLGERGRRVSNGDLAALAARVDATGGSQLVIGDLNRTDGSPHFREFLRVSGLRDSRLGFGKQPSWPSWSPYRIAIDHAFLTADLAVAARRLGPNIGSDHQPLILELAPAANQAASPNSWDTGSSSSR